MLTPNEPLYINFLNFFEIFSEISNNWGFSFYYLVINYMLKKCWPFAEKTKELLNWNVFENNN